MVDMGVRERGGYSLGVLGPLPSDFPCSLCLSDGTTNGRNLKGFILACMYS